MPFAQRRAGFSLVELLLVVAIVVTLLAVAIPNINSARQNAAETVVIREIQTIHQGQLQYFSQFGEYAPSLSALGPPVGGAARRHGASLIPAALASGEKNGYAFTMGRTPGGFEVHARPPVFARTGSRTFFLNEDGIVNHHRGPEPASAASPEIR